MANRTGISGAADNPDLEKRLLGIESALDSVSLNNIATATTDATIQRPDLTLAPAVTGFNLKSRVPGGFTVGWNSPTQEESRRLSRYEIHVASNINFTDRVIYFADKHDTSFIYSDGDPANSFYVRMRATGPSGSVGSFTGTLETKTGKLLLSYIIPDARYSYVEITERPLTPRQFAVTYVYDAINNIWNPQYKELIFANKMIEVRKSKAFLVTITASLSDINFNGPGSTIRGEFLLDDVPHASFTWVVGASLVGLGPVALEANTTSFSFIVAVEPSTPRVYNMAVRLKPVFVPLYQPFLPLQYQTTTPSYGGEPSFKVVSFTFRLIQLLE